MIGRRSAGQPPPPEDEIELWRSAAPQASLEGREMLFDHYWPFARSIAAKHHRGAGDVELQDLNQLAVAGLLEAIDRFDPTRGAPFRSFARRRITGAILDGIAKMSERREQVSFRNRIRAERLRSLSAPSSPPVDAVAAMDALADLALGLALGFLMDEAGLVSQPEAQDRRPNAYESLAWRELMMLLATAMESLPDREKLIVQRHYLDGISFDALATLLGLSKGRVSQLHRSAIERLKAQLSSDTFFLER